MRLHYVLVGIATTVACEKSSKAPRYEGPMPVTFGDCAGPSVAWVSGPKPLPFTLEQANDHATPTSATAVAAAEPAPKDPPPEPAPKDPPPEPIDPVARQRAIEAAVLGHIAQTQGGAFASLTGTGDISSGFDDTNIYGGLLGNEAGEMNGGFGFGRSGFGPGGTGQGWGTIGTGRYGTIGRGSGTGSGYGVGGGRGGMRGRSAVPTVSIGQPAAQGDLDKAIIRRYIKRNIQRITYCYEKQLLVKPTLSGTIMTQFVITGEGTVASAQGSGVDPEVASCVAGVIKSIQFPKPKGGGIVQVNYPFTFRPAGDSTPPSAGSGGAGSASGSGSAAGSGSAIASATGGAAPPAKPRSLLRSADLEPADARTYKPGQANPLRGEEAALVECLRQNPKHFGALVVELGYDAAGKVTKATAHGLDDERARTCVVKLAKRVKRSAGTAAGERCAVAFGEMPISALPALDVAADSITLAGTKLADPVAVMKDDRNPGRVPAVVDAITKRVEAITATSAVTSLYGPLLVRPVATAKMLVVNRVLASVLAGGDDFALGVQNGTDWQLLSPMALPVIPVPFGTGGTWSRVKVRSRNLVISDEERQALSLLITTDKVFVGVSRINEFVEIPRDAALPQKLATVLKAHKASATFADRRDLEIAADDDATYADFVTVVNTAVGAGFVDWQLSDKHALSANPQR